MITRTSIRFLTLALALTALAPVARANDGGMIFGISLGGALVSGDTGVMLDENTGNVYTNAWAKELNGMRAEYHKDWVRTDAGSGFAFDLKLGYNVLGYGSVETYINGHLNMDSGGGKFEGAAYWGFLGRYFPFQHFANLKSTAFDPNIYFGGGLINYQGYHRGDYDPTHKTRGWSGTHILFGAALDYYLNKSVSVGIDLRFILPNWKTFYEDWDDDITFEPASSATTFVFEPMANITFHFLEL